VCFSAPASFAVAAGTGLAGAAAIGRASERREIPLASVPLVFAAQQAIEGALWLALGSEALSRWVSPLATAFMFSALVVWPVWAPLAATLVERNRVRRLAMIALLVLAVPLALRGVSGMWAHAYGACVVQNSIAYGNGLPYSPLQFARYVLCACCPFLLSSHRTLRIFGAIVLAGLIISASLYTFAYVSVWCFFAAVSSVTIYVHFARAQRERANPLAR
jgi:hypothetical protein